MHLNNMNKLLLATTTIWLILINMSSMCHGSILRVTDNTTLRSFPADFLWGVGSSAYQVEGGWNADDKGQSILEQYGHNDTTDYNADITADSYHQWRRDVQMVRELNVKVYRFSISWPRIMPNGRMNYVSTAGIKYYNDLIDELLLYNITPAVTMYHWDLPILLQQFGGWTNPEIIPLFTDYARLLFETFGDRVKLWTTMNEPYIFCEIGYGSALLPPGTTNQGIGGYMCGHNVLKAHADAYHMYVDEFKPTQNGQIGIVFVAPGAIPKTDTPEDREATDRTLQFLVGWFAHPIFSQQGNYPQVMIDRIGNLSAEQGFKNSRLPTFTQAEIEHIRGTSDFFGINTYTSNVMSNDYNNSNNNPVPSFLHDIGTTQGFDDSWPVSGSFWIRSYPPGMYSLLMWIDKEYNHPAIIVMENGVSGRGALTDYFRVDYINSYLLAVLDAMEAGANVIGYFIWSLMDSYEWTSGYVEKYGLYHVDFTHPDRTRTPKASALAYARTCKTGQIDVNYYPVVTELVQPSLPSKPSSATQFSSQFSVVAITLLTLLTRIVMQ